MPRPWMLLALALFATPTLADEPAVTLQPTEGTELSKKDDAAVRKVLTDYLDALKTRDFAKAGELLDRPSLLATVDPMVATIASDSTTAPVARRKIFGVSTRDSIETRPNAQLFSSLMGYLVQLNPGAIDMLKSATIQVLATRQIKGKASVAYQLTVPSSEPGGMPFEQVTAQQMRKVDGKWKILFRLEND